MTINNNTNIYFKLFIKKNILEKSISFYTQILRIKGHVTLGMRGILVLEKYFMYLLYIKRYVIIIFLISVFHTLLLQSSPVGGSAFQIAAQTVVNVTT